MSEAADDKRRAAANRRKRLQRKREREKGVKEVRMTLSTAERERLAILCRGRSLGYKTPYNANDYMRILLARDWKLYQKQLAALDGVVCQKCKSVLPLGCEGLFKGDSACFYSIQNNTLNI